MPKRNSSSLILSAFVETPWAILPRKLAMLEEIVARHLRGEKLSAEAIQARVNGATPPAEQRAASVAVLPLFGTIFPRANSMDNISGGTNAETFGNALKQLVNDPSVDAIVLDVDSPGGQVGGIRELADSIFAARGAKPVVAVANHLMASAAYWIASAADEIVVTPSGEVGSIGVYAAHVDISKNLEQEGVKVSLISKGKRKVQGNPYEPLSDEARAAIEESVGEAYDLFVEAVARGRGVTSEDVRNGFGEGAGVNARQAVALGMADRIGTLDETIQRLLNSNSPAPDSTQAPTSVNLTPAASSEPLSAEKEREAQTLRERVNLILTKENPHA